MYWPSFLSILVETCSSTFSVVVTKNIVIGGILETNEARAFDRYINGQRFSKELKIFEATREKNKNLKLLLNSLKSIPPTSAQLEPVEHV